MENIVALVPIARVNFDIELAEKTFRDFRARLILGGIKVIGPQKLVTNLEQAQSVAKELAGANFDLLVIFQATFADSQMATALAEAIEQPTFLWAVPEERNGGRLRLNSLCGINLAAHALTLRHIPYDYVYAAPGGPKGMEKLRRVARAGQVLRRLKGARLGVVGERPAGMDTCNLDQAQLEARLGVQVVKIELAQVFERVRAMEPEAVAPVRARLEQKLAGLDELDQPPLNRTLSAYKVLQQMAQEYKLDGLAVRCWPEFFEELKCSACGAISMLTDERIPTSCEGDINGTVTQLILQWLSGAPAMGSDLVAVDEEADEIVLWHCGLAPLAMADPESKPHGTIHSNRKLPLLMEFTLKPGKITVARLSQATGELRLVVSDGEMLARPPSFSGTSGVMRLERSASQVLDALLRQGLEHHVSFTYGQYKPELLKLAEWLQLPVFNL